MIDRRRLIAGAAGLSAAATTPLAWAQAAPGAGPGEAARLNALMNDILARTLRRNPETTSGLGLDKGDLAWTKSVLSDESLGALAEDKAFTAADLGRLRAIRRAALSGMDAVNYDSVAFNLGALHEGDLAFDYGGVGQDDAWAGAPYVLSQLTGSYQSTPDFLENQHRIADKADADAYLARLEALGRLIDQESDKARHDAALGVIPPDFVIDAAVAGMRALQSQSADQSTLVGSLARRVKEQRIEGDYAGEASRIYQDTVRPALERQIALVESWRPRAVHDAGVWRLPKGGEYYALSLRQYTTTTASPAEVHRQGLELVAEIAGRIDALMRKQGMTEGTVGRRLRVMFTDKRFIYPDTDEGKAQLIADLNRKVGTVEAKLPQWFGRLPKATLQIQGVPKTMEASEPAGYYTSGSLDGVRPGVYWINLRDTAELPSWTLPTLTFHEGVPGHHLQGSLSNESASLPLLRKIQGNSGYAEGWALYAEELAVEMGLYDDDPFGHIGQLHDALLRAARMVLDSGIHDRRWSRERAIAYYADTLGDPVSAAATEVDRYCVWPGQAPAYMLGKLTFLRLRDKAKAALGGRFDIRAFHDAVLLAGNMPLTVMALRVDDYIASAKAA
ncbi:MAG TPA: DUF885 family protein [Caulobacteraceae bacterium]